MAVFRGGVAAEVVGVEALQRGVRRWGRGRVARKGDADEVRLAGFVEVVEHHIGQELAGLGAGLDRGQDLVLRDVLAHVILELDRRQVVAGEQADIGGVVEFAVDALKGGDRHDGFFDSAIGGHDAHALGFVGQGLLGDETFEALLGDLLAQGGRDLARVWVALGDLGHVLPERDIEIRIGDGVALDVGDRGRVIVEVELAGHAPADEGRGEDHEEDARGPGIGHLAKRGEHWDPCVRWPRGGRF